MRKIKNTFAPNSFLSVLCSNGFVFVLIPPPFATTQAAVRAPRIQSATHSEQPLPASQPQLPSTIAGEQCPADAHKVAASEDGQCTQIVPC